MNRTQNKIVRDLFKLMKKNGNIRYGEKFIQLSHACTTAHLLRNTTTQLRTSGLLHDIAYFLPKFESYNEKKDNFHEEIGAEYLMSLGFPRGVYEPIRLHVQAKRYLAYKNSLLILSDASHKSLKVQGGPMTSEEAYEFEDNPFFPHAVRLRIADDKSKHFKGYVPSLDTFFDVVKNSL